MSMGFLGIVGNSLVLHVTLSYKRMRTPTNMLLLHVAVTDIVYLLGNSSYPVIIAVFAPDPSAEFPFCQEFSIFSACSHCITVYTLLTLSIIRYIVIVHPQHAKTLITIPRLCTLTIAVSILVVVVLIVTMTGTPCRHLIPRSDTVQIFLYNYFVFTYAVPLLLISLFSCLIFRVLRKSSVASNKKSDDNKRRASRVMFAPRSLFVFFRITL